VKDDELTGRTIVCVMIDGTAKEYPTAMMNIETPFLNGSIEAVCMDQPLYNVLIGNRPGVRDHMDVTGVAACEKLPEVIEAQAVVTRGQAQKDGRVKPLKVAESIDCELTTAEIIEMQQDKSLSKWCQEAQEVDTEDAYKQNARFEIKNGMLWMKKEVERTQLVVPVPLREKVMKLAHDGIMSGHQGVKKTYDKVVAYFFRPGVHGDVVRYCHSCDICQRTVIKGKVTKTPLEKMPLIEIPFQRVAVDLVGPIAPVTDKWNRYILTMMDYATRYPEAVFLKSIEAETVAEALVTMFS